MASFITYMSTQPHEMAAFITYMRQWLFAVPERAEEGEVLVRLLIDAGVDDPDVSNAIHILERTELAQLRYGVPPIRDFPDATQSTILEITHSDVAEELAAAAPDALRAIFMAIVLTSIQLAITILSLLSMVHGWQRVNLAMSVLAYCGFFSLASFACSYARAMHRIAFNAGRPHCHIEVSWSKWFREHWRILSASLVPRRWARNSGFRGYRFVAYLD
eukprot:TRINITY_DN6792_c0_g1_i2.p1 TRINITY_DN6792_c0_g1~~TRINITY_DN6792_c0_g1_i2.p1  ORF type:complete len:218 (-),score=12.37 TRINITY_DN6792_c0_g1_i2:133-786(-)